jgi:beta-glucosidase
VSLAVHDDYPAQPGVCLNDRLAAAACGEWATIAVPLAELAAVGCDLRHVDVPFMLYTEGTGCLEIRGIRWEC